MDANGRQSDHRGIKRQKSRKSVPLFSPQIIGALGMGAELRPSPAISSDGLGAETGSFSLDDTTSTSNLHFHPQNNMLYEHRFSVAAMLVRG